MENKYINRYHTFCKSLQNLGKSRTADPDADFVLEGTVQNFNLTFDISWKVMKDILVKQLGITDFAIGSPRAVLQTAFTNWTWFSCKYLRFFTSSCLMTLASSNIFSFIISPPTHYLMTRLPISLFISQ